MPVTIPEEVRIEQINSLKNIKFIRWKDSYENSHSKAVVYCSVDGYQWPASVHSLVNNRAGCPSCAGVMRRTSTDRERQINSIRNIEFVRWPNCYKNCNSKVTVRCLVDGYEWTTSVRAICNNGSGCPQCSRVRRWSETDTISRINKISGISFMGWKGEYKNAHSKALVRCEVDGNEWFASVNGILSGRGCSKCSKTGYDPSKTGYIYVLIGDCGRLIKIGISNNPNRRHAELKRRTPFGFTVAGQASGDGDMIAKMERYFHHKHVRAGLVGFDGCTEWLVLTESLRSDVMLTLSISV